MTNYPIYLWQFMSNKQIDKNGELMDKIMKANDAGCYGLAGHFKQELEQFRAECWKEFKAKVMAFDPEETK